MTDELSKLLAQRRALDKKIRELKSISVTFNRAKYDVEHYPTDLPDRHYIAVEYMPVRGRTKWTSIISGESKEEVIREIPAIVESLQGLYGKLVRNAN